MFHALGRLIYRRRWAVLAVAVAFMLFSAVWGIGVFGALSGGGFEDPKSDSVHARQALDRAFGRDDADVTVLYSSDRATVDDPNYRSAVTGTLDALPATDVRRVTTFWSTGSPALVSKDRRSTYAVLQLSGADDEARTTQFEQIEARLDAPGLREQTGGIAAVNRDLNEQITADIGRAEGLSLPVVFVLLVIMLGGLAAASLPLAVGGLVILGSFTTIRLITFATDVSVFAINIVTLLGLGLAIDYGLFMVNRFREELRRGYDVPQALSRTMATAGRTVAVSGTIVAIALSALMIFPQVFLRSMGFGGIAAVLLAMVGALTVMPALMAVLGHRIDALSVRPLLRRLAPRTGRPRDPSKHGAWYRIAHSVMRRPVWYVVGLTVVLLLLGAPFLRVTFGGIDERALPAGTESRVVAETLDRDFGGAVSSPAEIAVLFSRPMTAAEQRTALSSYVQGVKGVPGVSDARVAGGTADTARIAVTYPGDALSATSRHIVAAIRHVPAPSGADVLVGGSTAELVDLLSSLGANLPWMALTLVAATLVLLFLAFGSVLLPIKAVVMNVLSLGATFGALVLIFQDGHLSSLLGFTSTGTIEATQPILMLAIAFGLSMDYEVFLLSRIREQYNLTGDNTEAVATGLQRTGGIITSAALLLVIVIGSFSTSGITFIKLIGVGMIIAIVVDATIVRALLVPATMRLMGDLNWWAPRPLRRVYSRYGIREDAADTLAGEAVSTPRTRRGGRHRAVRPRRRLWRRRPRHAAPATSAAGEFAPALSAPVNPSADSPPDRAEREPRPD
jgi:trehalose monomycolate/heme transporter